MRARFPERCRSGGFTLIEVLVALAIVGLALSAAAGTIGGGLASHEAARDAAEALAIAEDQIAQIGAGDSLHRETRTGTAAERFGWQLVIVPYDDPQADRFAEPPALFRLFRVTATVSWQDGHRQRQVALGTLRLGRVPP